MQAKTEQDIRSRRKDKFGTEYIVENPDREAREFDMDEPSVMAMVMGYVDWLAEQGCEKEAELMMLDWSIRVGNLASTKDTTERIKELRKYFGIEDRKLIHKKVPGPRGREQTITLFLQEPMGQYFTKATLNVLHMEEFLDHLHEHPIMSLLLACNGTNSPALVSKYLSYTWLKKCSKLELNNLEIGYTQLREMFKGGEIHPLELVITGRNKTAVTPEQLKILPLVCPPLKNLWSIDYHGVKYDYRLDGK